jgi:hypothetical protein
MALPWVKQVTANRLETWDSWQEVADKAHGK